jgi:hypothetical protein
MLMTDFPAEWVDSLNGLENLVRRFARRGEDGW